MQKDNFQNFRNLVSQDAVEDALEQMFSLLTGQMNTPFGETNKFKECKREVLGLLARIRHLAKQNRLGILTSEDANRQTIIVANNTLELIDLLESAMDSYPSIYPVSSIPPETVSNQPSAYVDKPSALEKIWGRNTLKSLSWIHEGLKCSKAVCRIVAPNGLGTGFLLANGILMTNNHVLSLPDDLKNTMVEFNYEEGSDGCLLPVCRYKLDSGYFYTDKFLDCTFVRAVSNDDETPIEKWGGLRLSKTKNIDIGDHVIIIQHPNGGVKQIGLTANEVVNIYKHNLQYMTDTMPGSSGSPVFNDNWEVIAIHHAGGCLNKNKMGEKIYANQGILINEIQNSSELGTALKEADEFAKN
ncbi:MAG: trypsin-like peptidase domain-containing protein [Desulfobacteraceae bacterium]|nr:trypsin-like peptidase domain-containing protein [Desulfobacteraceae bacterium]